MKFSFFAWKKPNEELKLKNAKATGKGGLILRCYVAPRGVGHIYFNEGNMGRFIYISKFNKN